MGVCKWSKYKSQQIDGVTDWSTIKFYLEYTIYSINSINGSNIGFVRTAKSLGVTLETNQNERWKTNIRMLLEQTYLLPTLMYGCELFAS